MDTKSILVKDTDGIFAGDLLKIYPDKAAVDVKFNYIAPYEEVILSCNNIRYTSIPDINLGATYVTFLTYNGTMGYDGRIFSMLLKTDSDVFVPSSPPTMVYVPNNSVTSTNIPELSDGLLEINALSGDARIFDYSTTPYRQNNRDFLVHFVRSYPADVVGLPNVVQEKVFLDGWYSYTHVVFRDIVLNAAAFAGEYYAYQGVIFKASKQGLFTINPDTSNISIYYDPDDQPDPVVTDVDLGNGGILQAFADSNSASTNLADVEKGATDPEWEYEDQVQNLDYSDILFHIDGLDTVSPQAPALYLHSQVLLTQQLKDAIVREVTTMTSCYKTACDFMDWQKLQLKQVSSFVLFDNLSFEKAQIVIESSRTMCLGNLDNTKPC